MGNLVVNVATRPLDKNLERILQWLGGFFILAIFALIAKILWNLAF
jgi:hypothetical protein